jgi:hypothetical protein
MLAVNHEKKVIFVRIPKVASTYMIGILKDNYNFKHKNMINENHNKLINKKNFNDVIQGNKDINFFDYNKTSENISNELNMNEEKWENYTKFSFVRNPYDRIISGWKFLNEMYEKMDSIDFIPFKILSFVDFLKTDKNELSDMEFVHSFMTQSFNLKKDNINIIGKYENLEEDFKKIMMNLGFNEEEINHEKKIINESNHKYYKQYYDDESIQLVNELFKEDFVNYNYKMVNNMEELKKL